MNSSSEHISWTQYFMALAVLSSQRSKDPHTKVGACIVGKDNVILSVGYNGFPNGCNDSAFPWGNSDSSPLNTKYPYVVHAELNSILNARGKDLRGATLYTSLFPCNECTKAIIQVGIANVVYLCNKYAGTDSTEASLKMMKSAGVKYSAFTEYASPININLTFSDQ